MHPLEAISPADGRYRDKTKDLAPFVSEMALIRYRLMVEVEYFIALGNEKKVKELKPLTAAEQKQFRSVYKNFTLDDAEAIKKTEETTNHDVKAVEYFLKSVLQKMGLGKQQEFVHFALTSEDVNNLAYSLMWRDGLTEVSLPAIADVLKSIQSFAREYKDEPMLALTHGQPATPTTVGKEFAVFAARLRRQLESLKQHTLLGKLNGATGGYNAMVVSYPSVNWPVFSKKFVASLGLEFNPVTTQIEPHDSLAEQFRLVQHINTILLDFTRDMWLYIYRGIFGQKKKAGEIGSSTMPHKINPIHFENAEGNLGLANAVLSHLAEKLPISRMQRDLSDSTVLRNLGVPLAYSLIAYKNILTGLSRLTVNTEALHAELDNHWEVLAEAIQTILRKVGHEAPYEKLKELTRGQAMTKETIQTFIEALEIPTEEKKALLALKPHTYIGLASKIVS